MVHRRCRWQRFRLVPTKGGHVADGTAIYHALSGLNLFGILPQGVAMYQSLVPRHGTRRCPGLVYFALPTFVGTRALRGFRTAPNYTLNRLPRRPSGCELLLATLTRIPYTTASSPPIAARTPRKRRCSSLRFKKGNFMSRSCSKNMMFVKHVVFGSEAPQGEPLPRSGNGRAICDPLHAPDLDGDVVVGSGVGEDLLFPVGLAGAVEDDDVRFGGIAALGVGGGLL
jgi:hypothetical protein